MASLVPTPSPIFLSGETDRNAVALNKLKNLFCFRKYTSANDVP